MYGHPRGLHLITHSCPTRRSSHLYLAQRTAWTSAVLRTRVDTARARRNRVLLASMDRRTALQLRLQHTVEGLSVVAISYYALGLWHHLKDALEKIGRASCGERVGQYV